MAQPTVTTEAEPAQVAYEQEIRFAVVMYGGVSLAIYINGVAQELLNLVRATAAKGPTESLLSDKEIAGTTMEVYREISRVLRRTQGPLEGRPIRTRFVVDVISGTSAGGLNGIYLAKALVNDQPIDGLKDLWVDEADISRIVNDDSTYDDLGFDRVKPPESALNSRRMYWKLLDALDRMDGDDRAREETFESPYVEELDLWITTTDIRGVTVPIDTFDRFVFEKRHRKVFHFVYATRRALGDTGLESPKNDFLRRHNPFLAFAGRCTSSFPFALGPKRLCDFDAVLDTERFRSTYEGRKADNAEWRQFFEEYLRPGTSEAIEDVRGAVEDTAYRTQFFADGGYLDNRPFSWATQSIGLRRADVPVDRRLLYIEPDPGDAGLLRHLPGEEGDLVAAWKARGPLAHIAAGKAGVRPNAIENSIAALTGIPRAEPIRDDIAEIVRRNRELERIDHISSIVNKREALKELEKERFKLSVWRKRSIATIIRRRGIQYGAYHRLKVAAVADDLAEIVTQLAGFVVDSDEYSAIRCYVEAWIELHYPETGKGEQSQNEFLLRYDLDYRLRRTSFIIRQADLLASEHPEADLRELRRTLNAVLTRLRAFGRALRARTPANPLREVVAEVAFKRVDLRHVLDGARSKQESVARAGGRLKEADGLDAGLTRIADGIALWLFDPLAEARTDVRGAIGKVENADARKRLERAFTHYEVYDSVLFPTSYGHVSESDRVEVVRISPQDATSILDETDAKETRRKLAGSEIHHFGGFFDRAWRRNDILWGRLDAAERLITSLLPEGGQRGDLLEKAQLAIVREELNLEGRAELQNALVQTLLRAGEKTGVAVDEASLLAAVAAAQEPIDILEFLKTGYEVDLRLDGPSTIKTVGRITAVTGEVLDGAVGSRTAKVGTRWVTRIGRLIWGLGEIATKRSIPALLWHWWAQLLILIAVLLIVGGAFLGAPDASNLGWVVVGLVLGVKIATWIAEELTKSGPEKRKLLQAMVFVALVIAALSIGYTVTDLYSSIASKVDEGVCRLPNVLEEPAQAAWPWDDDKCP